jgi:hypothetical protein
VARLEGFEPPTYGLEVRFDVYPKAYLSFWSFFAPSGCVRSDDRGSQLESVEYRTVELLHGFELETVQERAHLLPGVLSWIRHFFENGLEEGATELLGLIDQESEHHDLHKVHAAVLFAEAEVVLAVVALVFQCVEGLIFDLPPNPRPHRPPCGPSGSRHFLTASNSHFRCPANPPSPFRSKLKLISTKTGFYSSGNMRSNPAISILERRQRACEASISFPCCSSQPSRSIRPPLHTLL